MGTFKTKQDFLAALEKELKNYNVSDKTEILSDFHRHFDDSLAEGFSEEEICERLGDAEDISEIAKQYSETESDIYFSPETGEDPMPKINGGDYRVTNKIFSGGYFEIDVSTIIAKTVIGLSGDNNTYVDYKTNRTGTVFSAEVAGTRLEIKERIEGLGSWLLGFSGKSFLKVLVPRSVYDKINISGVSSNSEIDRLEALEMRIHSTSGNVKAEVWAESLELHTISGRMKAVNSTGKPANFLKVRSVSAVTDLTGFSTAAFDISSTSGTVNAAGINGSGRINIISGKVNLEYSAWNADLDLTAVSGRVSLKVPADSGVNLNFSKVSGGIKYKLGDDRGFCSKSGEYSFGGINRRNVCASLTGARVTISDEIN